MEQNHTFFLSPQVWNPPAGQAQRLGLMLVPDVEIHRLKGQSKVLR